MNAPTPDRRETEAHLIALFSERCGVSLTASADLSEIGIDSVAMAELLTELEDEFDVRVDQDIFEVDTISALAAYIETCRSANQ